jgi:hypothetical protein
MADGQTRWRKTSQGREPRNKRTQAICKRLRSGATYKDIAAEFEISVQRVGQIREYAGIERRRKVRARMAISIEDLDAIFTYHDDPKKVPHYLNVRAAAKNLARVILENTPASPDQTVAIRKVREAVMTANAAIALDGKF